MLQVKTFISQKDFIRFNFSIFFKNPAMIILTSIYCFVLVVLVFDLVMKYIHPQGNGEEPFPLTSLIIPIVGFSMVMGIYRASKKSYNSSYCLKKPITYTFSEAGISSQGNGFNSDLAWSTIYQVVENKKWLIIYQNKHVASVVTKTDFANQEQLREVRQLISSQIGLKHKLINN